MKTATSCQSLGRHFLITASAFLLGSSTVNALASTVANALTADSSIMKNGDKRIIFLRHGCTYMNEYLGKSIAFGAPNFSDIFPTEERSKFYQDSPLSPLGVRQAQELCKSKPTFLEDCELIVTSPLRRALQTAHIGLTPHISSDDIDAGSGSGGVRIPFVALPEAAERLYLVSDIGRHVDEIKEEYGYVDFDTGFGDKPKDKWWYQHGSTGEKYTEWRPTGKGQKYACPGEPDHHFSERMVRLYEWLSVRPEEHIAVVCHWGVIDWFTDMDFDNCQWRQLSLSDLHPKVTERAELLRSRC